MSSHNTPLPSSQIISLIIPVGLAAACAFPPRITFAQDNPYLQGADVRSITPRRITTPPVLDGQAL